MHKQLTSARPDCCLLWMILTQLGRSRRVAYNICRLTLILFGKYNAPPLKDMHCCHKTIAKEQALLKLVFAAEFPMIAQQGEPRLLGQKNSRSVPSDEPKQSTAVIECLCGAAYAISRGQRSTTEHKCEKLLIRVDVSRPQHIPSGRYPPASTAKGAGTLSREDSIRYCAHGLKDGASMK